MTGRFITLSAALPLLLVSCMEPAPKIDAIPSTGLALRVHVFGAAAEDGRAMFNSVRDTNQKLRFVQEGGDGEVLLGIDQDNARCVEPTAYCEFRVAYRIRNASGKVVFAEATKVGLSADSCSSLCRRALQKAAVIAVEKAASALTAQKDDQSEKSEKPEKSGDDSPAGAPTGKRGSRAKRRQPPICQVGAGPRLPSEEAEKRMAQIDALKRQEVLDEEEFECLRKAFLARL